MNGPYWDVVEEIPDHSISFETQDIFFFVQDLQFRVMLEGILKDEHVIWKSIPVNLDLAVAIFMSNRKLATFFELNRIFLIFIYVIILGTDQTEAPLPIKIYRLAWKRWIDSFYSLAHQDLRWCENICRRIFWTDFEVARSNYSAKCNAEQKADQLHYIILSKRGEVIDEGCFGIGNSMNLRFLTKLMRLHFGSIRDCRDIELFLTRSHCLLR